MYGENRLKTCDNCGKEFNNYSIEKICPECEEKLMKCIHCGSYWKESDLDISMTYENKYGEVKVYICPGCEKIMNGCDIVDYA